MTKGCGKDEKTGGSFSCDRSGIPEQKRTTYDLPPTVGTRGGKELLSYTKMVISRLSIIPSSYW